METLNMSLDLENNAHGTMWDTWDTIAEFLKSCQNCVFMVLKRLQNAWRH